MLTRILNYIREFCSLQPPKGASQNHWKSGFTLVELMVVIIIVNLLSGVAIPQVSGLIEKTREKLDLLKLYYLRDALNRALYEDDVHNIQEGEHGTCKSVNGKTLDGYLADSKGVALFIIQRSSYMPVNYQGTQGQTKTNNMCGLTFTDGYWNTALKEAGFGAVADIIKDRANNDNINEKSTTYNSEKNKANSSWWRTWPKEPIFQSKFLNYDGTQTTASNVGIVLKIMWSGRNPDSHSLEVFFAFDSGDYETALRSRYGTCFSTLGDAGCKNTK